MRSEVTTDTSPVTPAPTTKPFTGHLAHDVDHVADFDIGEVEVGDLVVAGVSAAVDIGSLNAKAGLQGEREPW